jgi:hypothetical protein
VQFRYQRSIRLSDGTSCSAVDLVQLDLWDRALANCEISGPLSGGADDPNLLGLDAVSYDDIFPDVAMHAIALTSKDHGLLHK